MRIGTVDAAATSRYDLKWPQDDRFFLTLDLECDFGTALPKNAFTALDHTEELVSVVENYETSLTCFVQTEVLEKRPEAVEELRSSSIPIQFHPHSHTHKPRDETDIQNEIETSTREYRDFFGGRPTGYRFPNGNVRHEDYELLASAGYRFDASSFPTFRPGHFVNTNEPTSPQYFPEHDLVELPFTVYSDLLRIPTTISFCRLLGRLFTAALTKWPPSVVVFNIHLHDLVTPENYRQLSSFYKHVYARNDHGMALLDDVLAQFASSRFSFGMLDDAHEALRARANIPLE